MVKPTKLIIRLRSVDLEHELDETDNIETITAYLDSTADSYLAFNRVGVSIVGDNADSPDTMDATTDAGAAPVAAEPPKKERKKRGAVEAVAPAPLPVPSAAPLAPPVPMPSAAAPVAVAVAPPPPIAAPVAPPAPIPPKAGVLGEKIVAELNRRKSGAADDGAGLLGWLSASQLTVPNATWDAAVDTILFMDDVKLAPFAKALEIAA